MNYPIFFKSFLFNYLTSKILSVNIDIGISEIISSANTWIIKIQDKKVKKKGQYSTFCRLTSING
jgi:hypothetical protein